MIDNAVKATSSKNVNVLAEAAEALIKYKEKDLMTAQLYLDAAIKIEPKNAENYLLMGDALLEKNPTEGGPAIKQYDKFSELNPKSPKGILRAGKLYQRGRNYQLALDLYKKAQDLDPTYAPAYREKAELYNLAGQKANAVESYKKYLELNNSDEARIRYAGFLVINKQYAEAITESEKTQNAGSKDMYLDRYLGYSYAELGNKTDTAAYTKGLKAINRFFEKAGSNFKYKFHVLNPNFMFLYTNPENTPSQSVIRQRDKQCVWVERAVVRMVMFFSDLLL